MPYITVSDVTAAAPAIGPIDAQSRPNLAQVNAMIVSEEREINAALVGLGYTTPITGPISTSIVKDIVTHGVIARVLRAKAYGTSNPADNGAVDAKKERDALLKRLADPNDDLALSDAISIEVQKVDALAGAEALTGETSVDYESPITRYTRF